MMCLIHSMLKYNKELKSLIQRGTVLGSALRCKPHGSETDGGEFFFFPSCEVVVLCIFIPQLTQKLKEFFLR